MDSKAEIIYDGIIKGVKMIFAANFKCNLTPSAIVSYFQEFKTFRFDHSFFNHHELMFFPSFLGLLNAIELCTFGTIGAQNAYPAKNGAFSGEVGLEMLESINIRTLLIGHSERRDLLGESQDLCAKKFRFYADAGFKIVYCIGESLEVKNQGEIATQEFLRAQLSDIDLAYQNLIIAYEPVWAIGTGKSASVKDIGEVHSFLRTLSDRPILYGGSVNETNAKEILQINNVDGLLIGSASLNPQTFYNITQKG